MRHHVLPAMLTVQRKWETCMLKSYKDTDGTWHIGFGHGNAAGLPPFVDEHTILKDVDEAIRIQLQDLEEEYAPQLNTLLDKTGIEVNVYEWNSLLDTLYNRGGGRLAGPDAGSKDFKGSYAWHLLKQPTLKNYKKLACQALVISNVDDWTPLNVAQDRETKIDRVYLGLTLRRIDDAALWLTEI
jgi:GH24 family phage-related lysozyme (muramidase)